VVTVAQAWINAPLAHTAALLAADQLVTAAAALVPMARGLRIPAAVVVLDYRHETVKQRLFAVAVQDYWLRGANMADYALHGLCYALLDWMVLHLINLVDR